MKTKDEEDKWFYKILMDDQIIWQGKIASGKEKEHPKKPVIVLNHKLHEN